jgi:hypothetical protein
MQTVNVTWRPFLRRQGPLVFTGTMRWCVDVGGTEIAAWAGDPNLTDDEVRTQLAAQAGALVETALRRGVSLDMSEDELRAAITCAGVRRPEADDAS